MYYPASHFMHRLPMQIDGDPRGMACCGGVHRGIVMSAPGVQEAAYGGSKVVGSGVKAPFWRATPHPGDPGDVEWYYLASIYTTGVVRRVIHGLRASIRLYVYANKYVPN